MGTGSALFEKLNGPETPGPHQRLCWPPTKAQPFAKFQETYVSRKRMRLIARTGELASGGVLSRLEISLSTDWGTNPSDGVCWYSPLMNSERFPYENQPDAPATELKPSRYGRP